MTLISGNEEDLSLSYRLTVIVENTKDFTELELAKATAVAVTDFVFENLSEDHSENWDIWSNGRFGKLLKRLNTKDFNKLQDNVTGKQYSFDNIHLYLVEPMLQSEMPTLLKRAQISNMTILPPVKTDVESESSVAPLIEIFLNEDLNMSPGKSSIAAAHSLQVLVKNNEVTLEEALNRDNVRVVFTKISEELKASCKAVINDAGLTEVIPGSTTSCARVNRV